MIHLMNELFTIEIPKTKLHYRRNTHGEDISTKLILQDNVFNSNMKTNLFLLLKKRFDQIWNTFIRDDNLSIESTGRRLFTLMTWNIPLYFNIYFIVYMSYLVIKSIARHKIKLPFISNT